MNSNVYICVGMGTNVTEAVPAEQNIELNDLDMSKPPEEDTIHQNMKRDFIFTSECPRQSRAARAHPVASFTAMISGSMLKHLWTCAVDSGARTTPLT